MNVASTVRNPATDTAPGQQPVPRQWPGLLGWFAATFAAAALGGLASMNASTFYGQLVLPAWAPPAGIFGPVWTLLYSMMAIAAWLVWRDGGFGRARIALRLFIAQLVANALWSFLFFGWKSGPLAFGEVLVLWTLVLATLVAFWRLNRLAGAMLLPYLAWVSFATALTYAVWQRNPVVLG